ncbi:MAG: hypothetical protein JSR67_16775 [Proteobacteria bacterium]|nr:hypothetical protein [Pseudomonadota bacterium]
MREALEESLGQTVITKDAYIQYLSDQAYMVHDVCRQMLGVAAHKTMLRRPRLRKFLIDFGLEEETHHRVAEADIRHLGGELQPPSLDAKLWFMYFASLVRDEPFRRIGASIVLENSGKEIGPLVQRIFAKATFLNDSSTRFVRAHLHDDVPHGDQLLEALGASKWTADELRQLTSGIEDAGILLARLIRSTFGSNRG